MLSSLSSKIRDIVASMIEIDNTPSVSDDNIKEDKMKEKKEIKSPVSLNKEKAESRFVPTALPKVRAPRRLHNFKKKWNPDSKRELMRDYMRNYRAEGKDVETGNRYVKKIKIKG